MFGIIAILAFIVIGIGYYSFFRTSVSTVNVSRTAVIKELRQLNRLETASFTIEKIIDAKTDTKNRFQELLFGDKLLLVAHGEVIAGIDLSQLSDRDISVKGKDISLTLPQAQILVTRLDNEQTRVYNRQTGIFTRGDKDLEAEAREAAESSIRTAACDGKILTQASENARKQLTAFFQALGFEVISITIPIGTCV